MVVSPFPDIRHAHDRLPSLLWVYGRLIPREIARRIHRGAPASIPALKAQAGGIRIDPDRLRFYRNACGFGPGDEVPLTYPQMLVSGLEASLMLSPKFPLPGLGIVHVASRIDELRALKAGDRLDIRCALGEHRQRERGFELDVFAEASVSGEAAWRATSTMLWRRPREHRPVRQSAPPRRYPERCRWNPAADTGRAYARLSGDYNPIHLSALTARLFGYRRPVAHGLWLLARVLADLGLELPPVPRRLEAEFVRPVLLPCVASLGAERTSTGIDFAVTAAVEAGHKVYVQGALHAV